MSYEIALINPRRKSAKRRKASAKQIAARKRFVAKFAKGRKTRHTKARKSPTSGVSTMAKRRRRKAVRSKKGRFVKKSHKAAVRRVKRRRSSGGARHVATGYTVGTKRIRRRKLNPRSRRRYRRNPIGLPSVSGMLGQLVPAAYGAGGALALNLALSYIPLPDVLKTGWARHGVRIAGAFGIGILAKKFAGSKGNAIAQGALTVAVYDLLKEAINTFAPAVGSRLGEFEDVTLDDGLDYIDPASPISAYLTGDPDENNGVDGNLDGVGVGAYMQGNLDGNTLDM